MTSQKQISLFTEDESTYLQEASHVNPLALQVSNLEQKMTATSGRKCLELFERSPRSGSWAKTFAALLIGQGDWYSSRCRLTWKLKGTKSSRLYFQRVPSMLPTDGTGFGLLPTPCVADTEGSPKREDQISLKNGRFVRTSDNTGTEFGAKLNDVARLLPTSQTQGMKVCDQNGKTQFMDLNLLPTPTAQDFKRRGPNSQQQGLPEFVHGLKLLKPPCTADAYSGNLSKKEQKFGNSGMLAQEVQSGFVYQRGLLPTPQARDEKNGSNITDGRFQRKLEEGRTIDLNDLARSGLLPTPVTSDATTGAIIGKNDTFKETSGLPRKVNQNGTDGSVGLARLVQLLPTPQATDFKGGATAESYEERGRGETNDLRTWAAFQERTGKTSQLNPLFVAEMMNFPVDWTLLPFLNGDKNQLRPTETP